MPNLNFAELIRIKYTEEMKCIIHIILWGILIVGSVRLLLLKDQRAYTNTLNLKVLFSVVLIGSSVL
jgi:hypothetical protein